MSNPTSNFGWQMPTPTDLVTDLPADFEVFGQAVDTSLADLKGGTTGQVLSKTTNADMDFTWVASNPGDITAVTAGTGISGGGTSGAVTITNDMATTITASGDIVVGTGSGTYDNLPIGTTGQILTADTTVSPYKVKWATPASGAGLVLIESGTFSATTSIITGAVFSATYKNYLFLMVSTTSNDDTNLRFRTGSTTTTTNYNFAQPGAYNTSPYTVSSYGGATGASFAAVAAGSVGSASSVFIANPFETTKTFVTYQTPWSQSASLLVGKTTAGFLNDTTSYDKIDIEAAGNISGHYAVYGYAK